MINILINLGDNKSSMKRTNKNIFSCQDFDKNDYVFPCDMSLIYDMSLILILEELRGKWNVSLTNIMQRLGWKVFKKESRNNYTIWLLYKKCIATLDEEALTDHIKWY